MSTAIAVIPKLVVTVTGKVKTSNLLAFHDAATMYVSGVNRVFDTDEAFGQAEVDIKALKAAEQLVKTESENIVAQTHDINEVLKTLAFIGEEFRKPRLEIEKEVKEQKDSIRIKLMAEATDEITEIDHRFVDQINTDFSLVLRYDTPDFFGAIKGLRTIESVKDGIQKEKDAAIHSMTAAVNDILMKISWFKDQGYMEYKPLFGDMDNIIPSETEGFKAMVTLRITNHKAAEDVKEDKIRERIRIEEENKAKAKVEAEAYAKAEAEAKAKSKVLAEVDAKAEANFIPSTPQRTDRPSEGSQEENDVLIARIRTARALCDTFIAMTMKLDDTSQIRLEMLKFLQITDWVE